MLHRNLTCHEAFFSKRTGSNILLISNQYSCDGSERNLSLALGLIEFVNGVELSVLGFVDILGWYLSCALHEHIYNFLDPKRSENLYYLFVKTRINVAVGRYK